MKKFYLLTKTLLVAALLMVGANAWAETTTVGAEDNTTAFWGAFSDYYTIAPNGTLVVSFTNYTNKANNYNNWLAVVTTDEDRAGGTQTTDGYYEYALLRADNYAYRAGDLAGTNTFDGTDHSWATSLTSSYNWETFKSDMDGSNVVMSVTRSGTEVTIYADITTTSGARLSEKLVFNCTSASEILRFFLSVDNSHIENLAKSNAISIIGATDYSSGYLAASSGAVQLKPGDSYRYQFVNHYNGGDSWLNWHLPVKNPSGTNVLVLRADWYEDINGSTVAEHQRGFSTNSGDYWDYVPSKINCVTVDMTVTFTTDKKFVMSSTNTAVDGTTWDYNFTSDNDNNVDLTGYDYLTVALSENTAWLELLSEEKTAVGATIGAYGYASFSSAYDLDFSTPITGLTAYKASSCDGTTVTLVEVDGKVKAGDGLVIKGTAGSYSIPVTTGASTIYTTPGTITMWGNTGTVAETVSAAGSGTYYVLSVEDEKVVFAPIGGTSATLNPGQAALWANVGSGSARGMILEFADEKITGINEAAAATEAAQKEGKFVVDGKLRIFSKGKMFNANGQLVK